MKYSKHGFTDTKTYTSWRGMINRCTNPNSTNYSRYGGSGITVCERWMHFDSFLADMGERPLGATLDRINGSRGYEPSNCRWATASQQQSNKSSNRLLELDGRVQTVMEWAKELGIYPHTIYNRIYRGTPIKPLDPPSRRMKKRTIAS